MSDKAVNANGGALAGAGAPYFGHPVPPNIGGGGVPVPVPVPAFDPNSVTAQIATILANQRHQGAVLEEIRAQVTLTNGRVTRVERWRDSYVGRATGIALAASVGASGIAWIVGILWGRS